MEQLNLSFEGDCRLADSIFQGKFLNIVEFTPPAATQPIDNALALAGQYLKEMAGVESVFGFFVDDRPDQSDTHDAIVFAEKIAAATGKPAIVTLSGRSMEGEQNRVSKQVALLRSEGLRNVFATTGNLAPGCAYEDAVGILKKAVQAGQDMLLGAAVNPYQYQPEGQCLQYAKVVRKINAGASFLVAQAGWDMKKSQELLWFLAKRVFDIPVFARVRFFSRQEAEGFSKARVDCNLPVRIASDIQESYGKMSLEDAQGQQLERLALQIAGYRKLGYSGCVISGLREASLLERLLRRSAELDEQTDDFDGWLKLWQKEFSGYTLSHSLLGHYLFRRLMEPGDCSYDAEKTETGGTPLPPPSFKDMALFRLRRLLASRGSAAEFPPACAYLTNEQCPKKLTEGACGSASDAGKCECGDGRTCFFYRAVRVLARANSLDSLE